MQGDWKVQLISERRHWTGDFPIQHLPLLAVSLEFAAEQKLKIII